MSKEFVFSIQSEKSWLVCHEKISERKRLDTHEY